MAIPEVGRGFSHHKSHLRSRHGWPSGSLYTGYTEVAAHHVELFWIMLKHEELDLCHTLPFAQPASWAAALSSSFELELQFLPAVWGEPESRARFMASTLSSLACHSDLSSLDSFLQPSPSAKRGCASAHHGWRRQARGLRIKDLHGAPGDPSPISDSATLYWVTSGKSQTRSRPLPLKMGIVIGFCLSGARRWAECQEKAQSNALHGGLGL